MKNGVKTIDVWMQHHRRTFINHDMFAFLRRKMGIDPKIEDISAELVTYLKTNGRKKVMFGTNYPMITPAQCLKDLESLDLDQENAESFLFKNAQAVFSID